MRKIRWNDHGEGWNKKHGPIEVRREDDEIVAKGVDLHIERMDDDFIWLRISSGDHVVVLEIYSKGKSTMFLREE